MASRALWLTAGATTIAVLTIIAAVPGLRLQTGGRYGRQSFSSSVGPVSPSVIGSWQAHGADDFIIENASPNGPLPPTPVGSSEVSVSGQGGANVLPPVGVTPVLPDDDWIIDLVVLWRWPGQALPFSQGTVGDEVGGSATVHRIIVDDRELRVRFDPQAGTAQIANGALVQLNGANVLMLDVGQREVRVAGTAMVDPRYPSDPGDPIATVIARSPEVAAFVNRTR
jgi:hypothetical protein